ncbi:unnamed protein product [Prunus brigantina]
MIRTSDKEKEEDGQSPKNPMSDKASCSGGDVRSLQFEDDTAKNGEHHEEKYFFVDDPMHRGWSVVLSMPNREYNDAIGDDVLGDVIIECEPFTRGMPNYKDVGFYFSDDVVYFNNDGDLASWFLMEKMTVDSTTIEKSNTRRDYLALGYAMCRHLTEKADVFNFKVVALEILNGRPNFGNNLDPEKIYLLEWYWKTTTPRPSLPNISDTSLGIVQLIQPAQPILNLAAALSTAPASSVENAQGKDKPSQIPRRLGTD